MPDFNIDEIDKLEALDLAAQIASTENAEAEKKQPTSQLMDMATRLIHLEERIAVGEELLKTLKAQRLNLRTIAIPEEMARLGMVTSDGRGSFSLAGGERLSIRNETHFSTKAEDRPKLLDWLRTNGAASLIKEDVHSSTLRAHCKELLADGRELPSFIAVYREQAITVARPNRGSKHE